MVPYTLLCTSIAALTGILAVGSGEHWKFTTIDYFRGKRNAILYLWVIASTIFSICHSGVLVEYGLQYDWQLATPADWKWMVIHSTVGQLLIAAHLFVSSTLRKEVGPVNKYLWGKLRTDVPE